MSLNLMIIISIPYSGKNLQKNILQFYSKSKIFQLNLRDFVQNQPFSNLQSTCG